MTKMEQALAVITKPMTVMQIAGILGWGRYEARHAVDALRARNVVHEHHSESVSKAGGIVHYYARTGRPLDMSRVPPRLRRVKVVAPPKPKRRGSGVIAPRPYAYGLLWSNR